MKEKLHTLWMYIKHSRLPRILFFSLLAIGVILYCLSHIPITKSMRYDMQGYIVSTDGEILEEFTFTITGKEYNFIIDPPGGLISFAGNELAQLERDAFILNFDWGTSSIAKKGISMHFTDSFRLTDTQIFGALEYFDPVSNGYEWDTGMFDAEHGNLCIYTKALADNAFIVGVSDPKTDPNAVIDGYLDLIHIPELED